MLKMPPTAEVLQQNANTLCQSPTTRPCDRLTHIPSTRSRKGTVRFADDLDVDRYEIDGDIRTVVIAARELNLEGVNSGWENQHVAFTHGYGVALAPANTITAQETKCDFKHAAYRQP